MADRPIHTDFQQLLDTMDDKLVQLYQEVRNVILSLSPESNELLYHTHALTSVYSITDKLGDAFCHIPIYTNHLNLGFNKGSLLKDESSLLEGTGKFIRHVPIRQLEDLKVKGLEKLIKEAIAFCLQDIDSTNYPTGTIISKIKK